MKRAAILLLLLLSIPMVAHQAHAEERLEVVSAYWGAPEQPVDARPGDSKIPLTLVVQNKYSYVIIGIYAELRLPEGFHNVTGGDVASAAFGPSLPPGGVAALTFLIDIDEDVEPGIYTFQLTVDYFDSVYSEMEDEFNITLRVEPEIGLRLSSAGWGTPQQPIKPTPGTDGVPLYLWITNPDASPVYGVNLTLILPEGVHGPGGERSVWSTIPVIEAGQSAMATFVLDVDERARAGEAEFILKMEYMDQWSAGYNEEENFTLPIYPEPDLLLSVQDVELEQGSSAKLNVTVLNSGSAPIYDVLPTLQAEGLLILSSPTEALDVLGPGEGASFVFKLYAPSNLLPGSVPALLTVSYKGPDGVPRSESSVLSVDVLLSSRLVEIVPSTTEVKYQRLNEVVLEVKNLSGRPIYNVEVSLTPPANLPLYVEEGVGPWRFDAIGPGSSKQIALHILPFAQMEGAAAITATVTYRDGDTTRSETQILLFYLKGYAEITLVNWKFSPDPAYNGSRVSFSASLLNRGTQQAYYTRVYVKASGPFVTDRMSDKYIGDLPTNSPTPFSLQFGISPDARPGKYGVEVVVEYTDTLGQKHEVSWPLELDVVIGHAPKTVEEGQQPIVDRDLLIIIGLAILLIISIIWGYRRGRREEEIEAV